MHLASPLICSGLLLLRLSSASVVATGATDTEAGSTRGSGIAGHSQLVDLFKAARLQSNVRTHHGAASARQSGAQKRFLAMFSGSGQQAGTPAQQNSQLQSAAPMSRGEYRSEHPLVSEEYGEDWGNEYASGSLK
mmetsp:Transcript_69263/g.120105  ORF Transcript_69263/g.120105 Transcript_69263/m.120105 type:complete len:135 (-) Transcript_69263:97-501(-)